MKSPSRLTSGKCSFGKKTIWIPNHFSAKTPEVTKEAAVLLTPNSAKINTDKLILLIYAAWLLIFLASISLYYLLRK